MYGVFFCYIFVTMTVTPQAIGKRRNLLLRYQNVMKEFDQHNVQDIPITVIHRKYIYPKFFISRDTLYEIFKLDIPHELEQLELKKEQNFGKSLFD